MAMRSKLCGACLMGAIVFFGSVTLAMAQHGPGGHSGQGHGTSAPFTIGMQQSMAAMAKGMETAPMTSDPDQDFLAMMIPHHEGAVEMARLVLLHGRDPLVRRMAEDVIATQQSEIVAMQNRLKILQAGPDVNPGGFPALSGTRGGPPNSP